MTSFLDRSAVRFALAVILAALALFAYGSRRIVADQFALGSDNFSGHEEWKGARFTASSPREIAELLSAPVTARGSGGKSILWLGNSQLHAINQFASGDHLAPYWLRARASCPDCLAPLALSLPNANMQELLVLYQAALERGPLDAVVLAAVFDDLREDGVRAELEPMLSAGVRQRLQAYEVGRELLARVAREGASAGSEENSGLEGFVQKRFEDRLTASLADWWPLWSKRPQLRAHLLTDLYHLRNRLLGIKATSVRRMIAPRLQRNMAALEALLDDCRSRRIRVLIYIAPIRQDVPLPYDVSEYEAFKARMAELSRSRDVALVNLEELVPAQHWGSHDGEEIDFMHFKGAGHQLLASAVGAALGPLLEGNP